MAQCFISHPLCVPPYLQLRRHVQVVLGPAPEKVRRLHPLEPFARQAGNEANQVALQGLLLRLPGEKGRGVQDLGHLLLDRARVVVVHVDGALALPPDPHRHLAARGELVGPQPVKESLGALLRPGKVRGKDVKLHGGGRGGVGLPPPSTFRLRFPWSLRAPRHVQDPRVELLDAPAQFPHAGQPLFCQASKRPGRTVPGRARRGRLHGKLGVQQCQLRRRGQAVQPAALFLLRRGGLGPPAPKVHHGRALSVAVQDDHAADAWERSSVQVVVLERSGGLAAHGTRLRSDGRRIGPAPFARGGPSPCGRGGGDQEPVARAPHGLACVWVDRGGLGWWGWGAFKTSSEIGDACVRGPSSHTRTHPRHTHTDTRAQGGDHAAGTTSREPRE